MGDSVFSQLMNLIRLMVLDGRCPWSREQSLLSMIEHILQECQEFSDAVSGGKATQEIGSEAGDILTLTLILCFLLEREGLTTTENIADQAIAKLRRRAPYLFRDCHKPITLEEADHLWELAKLREEKLQE
ncbi:MazG nucleotide pyrophosphohydrolase domain-containing protein [Candidatus Chlamydia sanziniae]|uniref:MazG protein domain n=1 Tax=Candidatus Chlamydia sanziniae TaxID=1806891 RepID=A0A1A9HYM0_9CHLA|nr:MazG nucleotide pyrophosphohydrolase domain-containing protein [Candidatus Chlamydia sanziniae]ANH79134.1 MazG protein domain [Candidatus Chlamydia sanziniae]